MHKDSRTLERNSKKRRKNPPRSIITEFFDNPLYSEKVFNFIKLNQAV